jgi:polygalacturonase
MTRDHIMPTRHLLQFLFTAVIATASFAAHSQATVKFADRVCDVIAFGATGTRVALDTGAFQKAIDSCARAGGGTVRVPRGEYRLGPIFIPSDIRLQVDRYAELAFTTDPALYKVTEATKQYVSNGDWIALINVANAKNVAIVGAGLIDGQGASWWERYRDARAAGAGSATNRPRLIHVVNSSNILVEGVTLLNSPSFHLVTKDSENITIKGTTIRAPAHSPNTDAIDPIDSRNVLIEGNTLDVGDDVVAIKSLHAVPGHPDAASSNIKVINNTCLAGRGISIGSETMGGVRNVLVENNTITGAMYGIRIKTPRERGGLVQDIVFRNNRATDVQTPFVFSSYYEGQPNDQAEVAKVIDAGGFTLGNQLYPGEQDPARPYVAQRTPHIRNVLVDGFTATNADRVGLILGLPEQAIENLQFRNTRIDARQGVRVRHASVKDAGLTLQVSEGPPLIPQRGALIGK